MLKKPGSNFCCAVLNCQNNSRRNRRTLCPIHECPRGSVGCVCPPPFTFIPFPTEQYDPKGRKEWLRLLNRVDVKTNEPWSPKTWSRICSDHFVDSKPTKENPYPSRGLDNDPTDLSSKSTKRNQVIIY